MKMIDRILERACFYGISNECFIDDIRFIFEENGGKESKRKGEIMEILEKENMGVSGKEIGERLGIKASNVASVILELRKGGVGIINFNGLYILDKFVNIG